MTNMGAFVGGWALAVAATGASSAIGASAWEEHPAAGAILGVGVLQAIVAGSLYARYKDTEHEYSLGKAAGTAAFGTAIIGSGAALGTIPADRRPALGAAVGAALATTLAVMPLLFAVNPSAQFGTSGAPGKLKSGARVMRLVPLHNSRFP